MGHRRTRNSAKSSYSPCREGQLARNLQHGSTLLETLVALLLMALIAAMIAPTFSFLGRLNQRKDTNHIDMNMALSRISLMRIIIEMPMSSPHPDIPSTNLLAGQNNALTFIAFKEGSSLEAARYSVLLTPEANSLLFTMHPLDRKGSAANTRKLYDGIESCGFTYWASEKGWRAEWPFQSAMPELIKISCLDTLGKPVIPIILQPAYEQRQKFKSRSSLVPPAIPSRP